jgi:hypothetical protein
VQQGRGVDELDGSSQFVAGAALEPEGGREQQHQHRPDPFAAGADDVVGNLVDQCDIRRQPFADHDVDLLHVGRRQRGDALDDGRGGWGRGGEHAG